MQKHNIKKIILLVLAAVMVCMAGVPSLAAVDVPDPDRTGRITVTMQDPDTEAPVTGGTLTLYQVGDVAEDNGDYLFQLTDTFSGSGFSLEDLESAELAAGLVKYAQANHLAGVTVSLEKDGTASFTDLKLGLYLLVQNQPAEGYYAVNPFLVAVPAKEGEAYFYDVNATPKMGQLVKAPEETKTEETKPEEQPDVPPVTPVPAPTLPQTGQLNWPVPVLAILGLLLFAIGWVLRVTGERKNSYAR